MMVGRLQGKVAVVTGSSRGIGQATAELFAAEGAKVMVNYNRSEEEARNVIRGINDRFRDSAFPVKADVSNEKEVKEMMRATLSQFGRIDVMVNNAGVVRSAEYNGITDSDLEEMTGTNLRGTLYCSREAAKDMVKRRHGKIVNIASIAALGTAFTGTTAYATTKAGVVILTRRLAFELGKEGINVNVVAPGFVHTVMAAAGKTGEEWEKQASLMASKAMLNRIGEPVDIANAVLFFSSEESNFVTGQLLVVDGGRMDYLSHSI